MAIPLSSPSAPPAGVFRPRPQRPGRGGLPPSGERLPRSGEKLPPIATAAPALENVAAKVSAKIATQAPAATQGYTLPSPPNPPEAKLERTPEQIAEQEALAKQVRQCMAGDGEAWRALVGSQNRRIYSICYRFTGSATDAEDLTQDVFLKLYKNLDSFDAGKGSFQTWITTLTRNLLVDHFRRTRLDRSTDSIHASFDGEEDGPTLEDRLMDRRPSQEQHVAGMELRAKVQAALKQISPELREAVILRDLQDMDYKDIAQVLNIPEGTVKSRISRGRGELARHLQRIEGQVV